MWCITIDRGDYEISQLFFKNKANAQKQMKYILIEYLNTLILDEPKIEVDDISNVETIEVMIRSILKQTIHETDKFDVTLSKCVFEDCDNDDELNKKTTCMTCLKVPNTDDVGVIWCVCNPCRQLLLLGRIPSTIVLPQ